jgi:putative Mg2+ transporter-C (MgtC) family protein
LARVIIRLIAATILGSIIGYEREKAGKDAGLRTHLLVTLGTCLFILACAGSGMDSDGLSRVIQGIVTGIGFLGAGSILKLNEERDIQGLTTAAGIWMTAAIGVAVGLGELGLALLGAILTVIVLALLGRIDYKSEKKRTAKSENN